MLIFQFLNANSSDFFTSEEIKKVFYHARFVGELINSSQNIQKTTIDNLRTYMVQQELQTDTHRKKVREDNKKVQGRNNTYNFQNSMV